MRILVDADATPAVIKEILFKTSNRLKLKVILVANQKMRIPKSDLIENIVVSSGFNVADDHIVDIVQEGDLVITSDIPLAERVINKNSFVFTPRGEILDDENIGERIAMRNLMEELRSGGIDSGGPPPFGKKDKEEFTRQLDKFLTRQLKSSQ